MKNLKKKRLFEAKYLLTFIFICLSTVVFAQTKNLTGAVVDGNGEPVIGATIMVKGSSTGTVTDADGSFSLNVKPNDVCIISSIGYQTQSIPVNAKNTLTVILEEDAKMLDELVVVGYGTQKKSDVTGALSRVEAKELEARPVTNAVQAMQGRIAGVDITSNERPGELGKILIRGKRSIGATNDPLYVVDGIPIMSGSEIETLNPRDIEAVDILKDASATAIYGSRGANGVIIVTTKKGKDGKMTLNYSGTMTIENLYDKAPMFSASEYITWRRWAAYNAGLITDPGDSPTIDNDKKAFSRTLASDPIAWNNIMRGWESGTWDGSKVINTDWTDFVTQTGVTREHVISASGGTKDMQTYASFGYLDNKGTMKGQYYKRYTTKVTTDIKPVKWFQLGASVNASWSNQDYGYSTLGAASGSGPNNIYGAARRIFNYALPYDDNGNAISMPGGDDAIYSIIDEWNNTKQERQMFRAIGAFYGQINFGEMHPILKGITYRLNFGPDYRNWREGSYVDSKSVNRGGAASWARLRNTRDFSWTLDNLINYNNTFGKHSLGLTLLQTASNWNSESSNMSGYGIKQSKYMWNAFGTIDITNKANQVYIGSGLENRQLESYMVRANYGFNNRYLLTASARWDGASQLAAGNKWDMFSSVALAWRIEQEDFMKDLPWIDQLKLRLGYGTTGNAAVDPYMTLGGIQLVYIPFDQNTPGYTTNEPNYTKDQVEMANKFMGWEKTTQYNLGLDFSFLKGRINGTIDVYKTKTNDLLLPTKIPTLTGYPNITANVGATEGRGLEISLNTLNIQASDFTWSTNINAGYNKSEVVELASGKNDDIGNKRFIGHPLGVYYDVPSNGLWQESDADEMAKYNANGHKFKPGMVRPVDKDGNYKIDASDREILGYSDPKWTLGIANTFQYRSFELSCLMYGRFDYMVNAGAEAQTGRYNNRKIDYWTPTNTGAEYQKPFYNESGGDAYAYLLGFRKANFLKMRNISLGYIVPRKFIYRMGLSNLKVYAQATNPFMISSSVDFQDLDVGSSTYNRGFVFGIDVSF